jgi:hypothetical protein
MKKQFILVGLSLGLLSGLFSNNVEKRIAFAQTALPMPTPVTAPNCPLPLEIAATFLNSQCKAVKLKMPQTFFRYHSTDQNKYGRYLTTDQYQTNAEVIRNLALNQSWGNQATTMLSVTLPAGTTVYQGIVGPQTPPTCYPGGGQQTFIVDSKDPAILWVPGPAMTIEAFTCPK